MQKTPQPETHVSIPVKILCSGVAKNVESMTKLSYQWVSLNSLMASPGLAAAKSVLKKSIICEAFWKI